LTQATGTSEAEHIATTRIGIIGGGQLGLMLSEAGKKMGFSSITVLDPTPHSPASAVSGQIVGSLQDLTSLRQLAECSDILTYEIEHINTRALQTLQDEGRRIYPAPDLLTIIQNKFHQKEFLAAHNIPVAPFMPIDSPSDIRVAIEKWGYPLVLKARKDAYDGRGNARINRQADIEPALAKLGKRELYIEQCLDLEKELGLMIARNEQGQVATHPLVEMIHERDICQVVLAPAPVSAGLHASAHEIARRAINIFNGIGIFGIEFFLDKAGHIWLNEIAPRPHNLGHFTIEGCHTSQFEQHLHAITNLTLTATDMLYPTAVMINVLGTRNGPAAPQWQHDYDHNQVFVHLYGKHETRVDRKMGHITVVGDDLASVYEKAKEARAALSI
jgi:5-(carboxyamino)imidazole ribonucleotide synthase